MSFSILPMFGVSNKHTEREDNFQKMGTDAGRIPCEENSGKYVVTATVENQTEVPGAL
jgi:hypothetical protein